MTHHTLLALAQAFGAIAVSLALWWLLDYYCGAPLTRRRIALRETQARADRECGEVNGRCEKP